MINYIVLSRFRRNRGVEFGQSFYCGMFMEKEVLGSLIGSANEKPNIISLRCEGILFLILFHAIFGLSVKRY